MDSTNTVTQSNDNTEEIEIVRNSIAVPIDLWKQIKKLAIDENRTANALTVDALAAYLRAANSGSKEDPRRASQANH